MAVELDGGRERRREFEDGGERELRGCAAVVFGHHALYRAVVGDSGVAQLHGLDGEFEAGGFSGGFVRDVFVGFVVGDVEVEEHHWREKERERRVVRRESNV